MTTEQTNTDTMTWRELRVYDPEGDTGETLGAFVDRADANLDSATFAEDGSITWPQFMLAAPGEDADWDTPRVPVDWTGFEAVISNPGIRK